MQPTGVHDAPDGPLPWRQGRCGCDSRDSAELQGLAAAAAVVILWSGFNIVSRLGGRSVLTPYDLAALRFGISALVLFPLFLRLRFSATASQHVVLAAFGGLGYGLFAYGGFSLAPAAHAAILVNGGIPFVTLILATLAMNYRPAGKALWALMIAGAGIGLVGYRSLAEMTNASATSEWLGDLLFAGAATSFAAFGFLLRKWRIRPLEATAAIAVISAAVYFPIYLLYLPKAITSAPLPALLLQGGYQGILAASLASLLYAYAVTRIGPMRASLMLTLVPGISAVAAVPLLGEELNRTTLLGVILVTFGAILGATSNPETKSLPTKHVSTLGE